MLPNQWSMVRRLRSIPDTVDDFTGYCAGRGPGRLGPAGGRRALPGPGGARVRNVELPADYSHVFVPQTSHLARDPAMRVWLNAYVPGQRRWHRRPKAALPRTACGRPTSGSTSRSTGCFEAQKVVRARRELEQRSAALEPAAQTRDELQ